MEVDDYEEEGGAIRMDDTEEPTVKDIPVDKLPDLKGEFDRRDIIKDEKETGYKLDREGDPR
jgi:hypothetical protein